MIHKVFNCEKLSAKFENEMRQTVGSSYAPPMCCKFNLYNGKKLQIDCRFLVSVSQFNLKTRPLLIITNIQHIYTNESSK